MGKNELKNEPKMNGQYIILCVNPFSSFSAEYTCSKIYGCYYYNNE